MSHLVDTFPASELPARVRRAPPWPSWQPGRFQPGTSTSRGAKGAGSGELAQCALMELVQYDCSPRERAEGPGQGVGLHGGKGMKRIECQPIVRLFRR